MPLSIAFELSDQDLEHFLAAQRSATEAAGSKSEEDVIAAGLALLADAQKNPIPDFIGQRLARLDSLIAMLRDEGWNLPDEDRKRVLTALVYFADPTDVIPDSVPVLGYLDDAIMIELCVRDLKHELDAYEDFCDYRELESRRRGQEPELRQRMTASVASQSPASTVSTSASRCGADSRSSDQPGSWPSGR